MCKVGVVREEAHQGGELELWNWFEVKISQFLPELIHEFVSRIGFDRAVVGVGFFPKVCSLKILVFMVADDILDRIFPLEVSDQFFIGNKLSFGQRHVIASDVFNSYGQIIQADDMPRKGGVR